jgi:hypothetical protein
MSLTTRMKTIGFGSEFRLTNSTSEHCMTALKRFVSQSALAMFITATIGCAASPTDRPLTEAYPALAPVPYGVRSEPVQDFAQYCPPRESFGGVIHEPAQSIERITSTVPWPRGLALVQHPDTGEETLIALARGRHRSGGGTPSDFDDKAGTLFIVDINISEPVTPGESASRRTLTNGRVLARPSSPPFFAFDHTTESPYDNVLMTRPYCGLDYDPVSRNLIVCTFAGAELEGGRRFRKHATDSLLRFDLRTSRWSIIEQHDHTIVPEGELDRVISNAYYPHHDPRRNAPPHGWLNGPTGCAVVGDYLYATSKDNHLVVQYDLSEIRNNPNAGPPPSKPVLGPRLRFRIFDQDGNTIKRDKEVLGAASVAAFDGWLYVGSRTTSIVYRVPLDDRGNIKPNPIAELIAVFEPWSIERNRSGNMFDMAFDSRGDLYVSMASNGRVWRITPDPANPFYADDMSDRPTTGEPFVDIPKLTGQRGGAGNIALDSRDRLYICTRNNDRGAGHIDGTIYRVNTR